MLKERTVETIFLYLLMTSVIVWIWIIPDFSLFDKIWWTGFEVFTVTGNIILWITEEKMRKKYDR